MRAAPDRRGGSTGRSISRRSRDVEIEDADTACDLGKLEPLPALAQLVVDLLLLPQAADQGAGHAIEGPAEARQLIKAGRLGTALEVPFGDADRVRLERRERLQDRAGDKAGGEQSERSGAYTGGDEQPEGGFPRLLRARFKQGGLLLLAFDRGIQALTEVADPARRCFESGARPGGVARLTQADYDAGRDREGFEIDGHLSEAGDLRQAILSLLSALKGPRVLNGILRRRDAGADNRNQGRDP